MAINPLKCTCANMISRAIPAAFDDSVSYLEMLMGILKKQTEVIAQVNKNTDFIEQYEDKYNQLQIQIDELRTHFEEYKDEVPSLIQTAINALKVEILDLIAGTNAELRALIAVEAARLDNRIDRVEIGDITLYDPTTGLNSPIQQVINNLYDSGREDALTASEFDALEYTATAFDATEITAFLFDTKGKTILGGEN